MSEPTQTTNDPGANESGIEADDTNATAIVVIGLVSTILVLASVLGVTALYDTVAASFNRERIEGATYIESEEALKDQYTLLTDKPRINPPEIGGYAIPIDDAMSLVVAEMRAEQETEKAD